MRTIQEIWDEYTDDIEDIDDVDSAGMSAMKKAQIEILEHFCTLINKSPLIKYENEELYLIDLKNELINKI